LSQYLTNLRAVEEPLSLMTSMTEWWVNKLSVKRFSLSTILPNLQIGDRYDLH
jgi:hypothetical protein